MQSWTLKSIFSIFESIKDSGYHDWFRHTVHYSLDDMLGHSLIFVQHLLYGEIENPYPTDAFHIFRTPKLAIKVSEQLTQYSRILRL